MPERSVVTLKEVIGQPMQRMARLEPGVSPHPGKDEFRQDEERDTLGADQDNGLQFHVGGATTPDPTNPENEHTGAVGRV